jgi:hypothetical protein
MLKSLKLLDMRFNTNGKIIKIQNTLATINIYHVVILLGNQKFEKFRKELKMIAESKHFNLILNGVPVD